MHGHFTISINEDNWVIYIADDNDDVIADLGSAATTDLETKEIFFRRSEIKYKKVKHELYHAYFSYLYLNDTNTLSVSDLEEIMARFFSDRAEKIIETSKLIYEKLLELKNDENKA
jgi:hypothetical protein